MRKVVFALAAFCIVASLQGASADEAYPRRAIKLIVPFAAGGNTDVVGRLTASYMQKALNANVVVENRAGAGGLMQFAAEIFRVKTGSKFTSVPYRGGALATAAVVTGEVQLAFSNMSDAMGQLAAGTVRPLAITTAKRSPHMPDIPTLIELGLVDYPVESWNALFAPAGTPQPVIDRLAEVMAQMAKDEEIRKRMADFGSIAVANTPAEFTEMLREETDQWAKALSAIGLKR